MKMVIIISAARPEICTTLSPSGLISTIYPPLGGVFAHLWRTPFSGGSRISPRKGRQLSAILPKFPKNCVKLKEFDSLGFTPRGGGASKILLCRSATAISPNNLIKLSALICEELASSKLHAQAMSQYSEMSASSILLWTICSICEFVARWGQSKVF